MKFKTLIVCFAMCASVCLAQNDRGTITGTILDTARAVVPGATVIAKSVNTGALTKTVSTETGNYTLPALPAGPYELSVEFTGFKKFIQQGIDIRVDQTARIDVELQVGSTSESINVTAEATLLRTENAEQSVNISGDQINTLPLNFGGGGGNIGSIRSAYAFNILSPGVQGSGTGARINGLPSETYRVQVEGMDATSGNHIGWESSMSQPSVDSIQEFSLQTSNFAAEFGQAGGGFYNFTTRSGTSAYHGTLYEYLTNEALDATRPFSYVRPISRKNDFGGTVGGPVRIPKIYDGRNRTFFFFSYEKFLNHVVGNGVQTLPTDLMRKGDFSQVRTTRQLGTDPLGRPIFEGTIYDPKTARLVNGQNVTDPFPGNLIPADRLDPVALKIQGFLPGVSNPGLANNWTQNALNHLTQYIPSVKIDQILNSNARLAYYVSDQRTSQLSNPDALPVPITAVRTQEIYGWTHRLNYDQTISPTLIMHLGTGYLRFYNPDSSPADVLDYDATKIGFTGSATTPGGFPRITGLSGVNSQGSSLSFGPTNANHYYDSTLTSVASLTWVRGNHTYKLGGEFRMSSWTDRNSRGSQGILNFNGAETALPYLQSTSTGGSQIGFPYASFLLGQVDNASVNAVQDPQLRKKSWGLYLQDTFKLTRKLTIDYGLRWDLQSEGHEIHYRTSMFGPTIPNPSAGGLPGALVFEGYGSGRCNCQFTKTYPYAIGPRLGAAYQIDSKTVLRAGWGISYGTVPNYQYITNQALLGVGFNQIPFASPTYGTPAVILQNGLKYNYADLYSATLNPGLLPLAGQINSPNYYIDPNGGRPPRINQWNISLQRQLTSDLLVEAAYVGNRGVWLGSSNSSAGNLINLNAINQSTLAARGIDIATASGQSLLRSTFASGTPQKSGFSLPYASFPPGQTLAQSLRPFPQFGNISTNWAPLGNSWYDSLQVKVTKRMSHGLSVTSAFTYSKTLASPSGTVNNVFNRPNQKGLASFDQPFILTIAADYQTPKITPNRYVQAITGGWTIDGIIQRTSGSLIASPQATTNLNTLVYQNTLMNRVPGVPLYSKDLNCHCIDPNKEFVLNPAAWADAPAGTWGTAAAFYGDYRQQRRPQEQASIGRIFRLREKVSFQIRAEFFNILNRTYLGNPSATNPTATQQRNAQGVPTAGYGFINAISLQANPRNGQIVGRLTW